LEEKEPKNITMLITATALNNMKHSFVVAAFLIFCSCRLRERKCVGADGATIGVALLLLMS
jgi:hypothetical protein